MSDHASLSPSAAHRWGRCPASAAEGLDAPRTSSVYADEGTAAHTLAARALDYGKPAAFWIGEQIQAGERVFTVDHTMADAVQVYLDYLDRNTPPGATRLHEQRVSFGETIGDEDQFGTADCIIVRPGEGGYELIVPDLKYGMGKQVFARNNWQLLLYLLATIETYEPILSEVTRFMSAVVQPRLDHIDEHTYTFEDIQAFKAQITTAAADAITAIKLRRAGKPVPAWMYVPSEEACQWCPVKATCEARAQHIANLVYEDEETFTDLTKLALAPAPKVPGADRLGLLFGRLGEIEAFARDVRAEIERMVFAGMTVIGPDELPMRLAEGRKPARYWSDEASAEGALIQVLPPDKAYEPRKLVSVAKAEKALKKNSPAFLSLQPFIAQGKGKPKVVLGSDPSPPYSGEVQADEFQNLSGAGDE